MLPPFSHTHTNTHVHTCTRSYKAYLDDFAAYCGELGGTTAEVMTDLLAFEVGLLLRLVV